MNESTEIDALIEGLCNENFEAIKRLEELGRHAFIHLLSLLDKIYLKDPELQVVQGLLEKCCLSEDFKLLIRYQEYKILPIFEPLKPESIDWLVK